MSSNKASVQSLKGGSHRHSQGGELINQDLQDISDTASNNKGSRCGSVLTEREDNTRAKLKAEAIVERFYKNLLDSKAKEVKSDFTLTLHAVPDGGTVPERFRKKTGKR